MSEACIGPNSCPECGGEYGEHSEWCESSPSKQPFVPTMNLRYDTPSGNFTLYQEFVRLDGKREWRAVERVPQIPVGDTERVDSVLQAEKQVVPPLPEEEEKPEVLGGRSST